MLGWQGIVVDLVEKSTKDNRVQNSHPNTVKEISNNGVTSTQIITQFEMVGPEGDRISGRPIFQYTYTYVPLRSEKYLLFSSFDLVSINDDNDGQFYPLGVAYTQIHNAILESIIWLTANL